MQGRWPLVLLAVGLGALHIAVSLVIGPAVASAIVAGAGIAYAALNFLLNQPKDSAEARLLLTRVFAVGKVTYAAAAITWLAVIAVASAPLVDAALSEEFTITVVDEQRQPAVDATVTVSFDGETRRIPMERGVGIVRYYPSFSGQSVQIVVDNRGARQTLVQRKNAEGRFDDVVIRVFGGSADLTVVHLTARGVMIGAFLRGYMPDDLSERFPRVRVIRNRTFEVAREFISMYRRFDPNTVAYSRTDARATNRVGSVESSASADYGDAWLQRYRQRVLSLPEPSQVYAEFRLNLFQNILGAPVSEPLPPGFLARMTDAASWYQGNEAVPSPEIDAWLRANVRAAARGPNGTVAFGLERLITADALRHLVSRAEGDAYGEAIDDEALAYVRYMLRNNLPDDLIAGSIHLRPREGCGFIEPHVALVLPEPELRVTILKNSTSQPIRISDFILTTVEQRGLYRQGGRAEPREERISSDVLEPGEALLVPRELFLRAMRTEQEMAAFRAPDRGPVATFRLVNPPDPSLIESYGAERVRAAMARVPAQLMLSTARILPPEPEPPAIPDEEYDATMPNVEQDGPAYTIGPSVRELEYVVNDVRIRARSDTRTVVAMVGLVEVGSCPFVFVDYGAETGALNRGPIITDQIGPGSKGPDRMVIGASFAGIELREIERETSYLDSARLLVRRGSEVRTYPALRPELREEDGRPYVLRTGQRLALDFGYRRQPGDTEIVLEVSGYYVPMPPVRPGRR